MPKKPTPRSPKEIDAEIEALEGCKSYAPARSSFGEDNHGNLDLQIAFLRGDIDPDGVEFDDYTPEEQDVIMSAKYWQDGEEDEAPSSGWDSFKK